MLAELLGGAELLPQPLSRCAWETCVCPVGGIRRRRCRLDKAHNRFSNFGQSGDNIPPNVGIRRGKPHPLTEVIVCDVARVDAGHVQQEGDDQARSIVATTTVNKDSAIGVCNR